jgi:DNA-binding response OmpR family regulator
MNNKKVKILLVEDDQYLVRLIKYSLEKAGFVVGLAENGQEALRYLNDSTPDLIICDIMMPIMDGLELRSKILQNQVLRSIPFMFLTAEAQIADTISVEELKVINFFPKPFRPTKLVEKVQDVLNKHNYKKKYNEREKKKAKSKNLKNRIFEFKYQRFASAEK